MCFGTVCFLTVSDFSGPFVLPGFPISPPRKWEKNRFFSLCAGDQDRILVRVFSGLKKFPRSVSFDPGKLRGGEKRNLYPPTPGFPHIEGQQKIFLASLPSLSPPPRHVNFLNQQHISSLPRWKGEKNVGKKFFWKSNICMNPWPDHLEGKEKKGNINRLDANSFRTVCYRLFSSSSSFFLVGNGVMWAKPRYLE